MLHMRCENFDDGRQIGVTQNLQNLCALEISVCTKFYGRPI